MKNSKKLLILSLTAIGSVTMSGCDLFGKKDETSTIPYSFSVALESGASVIELGKKQKIVVYNNGEDTAGRSFTYESTDSSVATVDSKGVITPKAPGDVNFLVTEKKSKKQKSLKKSVRVEKQSAKSSGGFNFSGGTSDDELETRAEILGKLEKYAMDTHLAGITLFDNGGYVKYQPRVNIPTTGKKYIQGFGFGVLSDGDEFTSDLSGTDGGQKYKKFYHTSYGQDPTKISMYADTGAQVSDLAGYISSSYWGTKLNTGKTDYIWAPMLASEKIYRPKVANPTSVSDFEEELSDNVEPVPMEEHNDADLYRKWRIYVKTDGDIFGTSLKYTKYKPASDPNADGVPDDEYWHGKGVTIDDYLFAYKLLLTGSTGLVRGSEMANDTSYGIKGAQRYYNATKSLTTTAKIDAKWQEFLTSGKLGLSKGEDAMHQKYIDIELINPIDAFTAKYTLSSNLVSPLPEEFFVGNRSISPEKTLPASAKLYGLFNNGDNNAILNYTICLGPYTLTKWNIESEIVFTTNKTGSTKWFEVDQNRYKIPGVYYRYMDVSTDTEKTWKQFNKFNLDSVGVPISKVKTEKDATNVYKTEGDSTFKLNVNSCTQDQWNSLFGPKGKWPAQGSWDVKPWMSNPDFLDGIFFSINRDEFAEKRGVGASVNYFSDAYQMRNSTGGSAYNKTQAHIDAVSGYSYNNGYSKDKAIDCFRNAVRQLAKNPKDLVLGTKEKPTIINIHIRWMYQSDIKDYGEDIAKYIESAFNDKSVCGGKVKLVVKQDAVTKWDDVYNVWMMQGRFDLAFGAISGNTYNPLNFLEVLKSDNSSGFTLNWGPDTSAIDERNPIIYAPWKDPKDHSKGRQEAQKWSFDALWEVADHGGIVENGKRITPVKSCYALEPTKENGEPLEQFAPNPEKPTKTVKVLYKGFKLRIPVEFAEYNEEGKKAEFDASRVDVYVFGRGNITLAENDGTVSSPCKYVKDGSNKYIEVLVSQEKAEEVNDAIKEAQGWEGGGYTGDEAWQNNPFVFGKYDNLFTWELYYKLTINNGSPSINYAEVGTRDN